ncbi:MAG TPA: hypothetical protein PK649_13175 [Vicingus sp.]|nr:hypothetical protein [Vicingus sp.]HRP61452.1 hypothetical protein [Vicingus sp.]
MRTTFLFVNSFKTTFVNDNVFDTSEAEKLKLQTKSVEGASCS